MRAVCEDDTRELELAQALWTLFDILGVEPIVRERDRAEQLAEQAGGKTRLKVVS